MTCQPSLGHDIADAIVAEALQGLTLDLAADQTIEVIIAEGFAQTFMLIGILHQVTEAIEGEVEILYGVASGNTCLTPLQ